MKYITAAFDNTEVAGVLCRQSALEECIFLIRKSTEEKVLETVTISEYVLLITVLQVLFYPATVSRTAYEGIPSDVYAALQALSG